MRPTPSLPVPTWRPPQDLGGRFRGLRPIDSGGMGQVYRASEPKLHRDVAIKFILGLEPDEIAKERLLREARAAAKVEHPNVVTIHDVDEFEGHPYIVMELLAGQTFHRLRKPRPWRSVLRYAVALAAGLGAAHQRGILHRDIKPANLFLTVDDQVKIIDFGLAKSSSPRPTWSPQAAGTLRTGMPGDAGFLTDPGTLVGTPGYLAPGAGAEKRRRARTCYSLGAVLFELCAGRAIYPGMSTERLGGAVLRLDAPSLIDLVPGIDPLLAKMVARCLARDPRDRYESGTELHEELRDLEAAVASRPISGLYSAKSGATVGAMSFRKVGFVYVSVISAETPTELEWNAYLRLLAQATERMCVLVVSAGGAPTRPQRLSLREFVAKGPVPVAVVSEAERVRNIVAEQRGLNRDISTFNNLDDALVFLGVEEPLAARIRREVAEMQRDVA